MLIEIFLLLLKWFAIFVGAGCVAFLLRTLFTIKKWGLLFIFLHGLILAIAALLFFNQPGFVFGEEIKFMNWASGKQKSKSDKAYQYVKDNYILVNTSLDKELIPDPEGDPDDSTTIAITSRKKLISFLNLLNTNIENVDMLICDIGFTDTTAYDPLLKTEFDKLILKDKLLIYYDGKHTNPSLQFTSKDICGDVREESHERVFISHTLVKEGYGSLPYKIYAWRNKISVSNPLFGGKLLRETGPSGKKRFVFNTFLPFFRMTDEERLTSSVPNEPGDLISDKIAIAKLTGLGYFELGTAIRTPDNNLEGFGFASNLSERKKNKLNNVIFLGAFKGSNDDFHSTAYGSLHGTVIMLNIVNELNEGRHRFSFLLSLFITIGLILVTGIIACKGFINFMAVMRIYLSARKEEDYSSNPLGVLKLTIRYFFKKAYYFLLILFGFLVFWFSGKIINILSLILYFGLMDVWFSYFDKIESRNKNIISPLNRLS